MSHWKSYIAAFIGGFLATLVFHQGVYAILYALDILPNAPFNMKPTEPLGVPSVISLAFFGGLWGSLIWWLIHSSTPGRQLLRAVLYGAVGPTAVAFLVVFPLKGFSAPLELIPIALLLNAAWGLGLWLFMRLTQRF